MPKLTYSPDSSPTMANSENGTFDPSLLWFQGDGPGRKIAYLNSKAQELGTCYVRLLIFCNELARLPHLEFVEQVDNFVGTLREYPLGKDIFVELPIMNNLGLTDRVIKRLNDAEVDDVYTEMMKGKARVKATRVEDSDLFHISALPSHPFCECKGSVCEHGWDFRMCMVALSMSGRRVGASGFNLEDFLEGMNEETEDFEEAFSQVTPTPETHFKAVKQVENWDQGVCNGAPKQSRGKPEPLPRADNLRKVADILPKPLEMKADTSRQEQDKVTVLERRLKALADMVELHTDITQRQHFGGPTPPSSPPADRGGMHLYQESLRPDDSSSTLSRYGRQYMPAGTVFTISNSGNVADTRENRTRLTVDNHLVDGYQKTELIVKKEASSVQKLRPINGLPRPFTSNRLNFLCNIHTAMHLKLKKCQGSYLDAMYDAMRAKPVLPVENLLCQVLNATIDRKEGTYTSNAFELPYIEVGMLFTEESVVKMFDLLQLEYKRVWFQEMKNLIVPNFHSDYKSVPTTVLGSRMSKALEAAKSKGKSDSRGRKGSKSVLGFPC